MSILDDYYDDYKIEGNPIPSKLGGLRQSELKKLLADHEERLDDWTYFNGLNPDKPPYSQAQIQAYEKDIAQLRAALGESAPMPEAPAYRELPEYRWQEEILRSQDLIETLKKQINHVQYYERNRTEAKRLAAKMYDFEIRIDYFRRQLEAVGELRALMAESEEAIEGSSGYETQSLKANIARWGSDINKIIRETNINTSLEETPQSLMYKETPKEMPEEAPEEPEDIPNEEEEVVEINLPFEPSDTVAVEAYLNSLKMEEIVEFAQAVGMNRIAGNKIDLIYDVADYLKYEYKG